MARGDDKRSDSPHDHIIPAAFKPPGALVGVAWPRIPWTRLVVLATFFVAGVTLLFIFGARSVQIMVDPATADLKVGYGLAPHFKDRWMLWPGNPRIEATASGYKALRGEIDVTHAPTQSFKLTLRPLPGQLRIRVAPVAAAPVRIDDQPAGQAPGVIEKVEAGVRHIVVGAPRYLDFEAELEVEGKGREQALAVTLAPAWADFNIASKPEGALVTSGRIELGVTPLAAELIHGEREITVTKQGFKPWYRKLNVVAGQAITIPDVRLQKDDGYFSVASTPLGAAVTVDGTFKGETPVKFAVTPDLEHTVAVIKTGYLAAKTHVTVSSGEVRAVPLELVPELAMIEFVTEPADAELILDGAPRGTANQRLELPTHEHEIIVRKPGYATYRTLITPR
ncbi:MAG: PEGA domain-containing protein, partial [Gammaproteobacteria bacterium]